MAMHISGLISGNDYQSMVDQLVEARRIPIDSKQSDMDELDYDLGAWTELQTLAQDLTDTLDTLRGYELWRNMNVSSTYESVATASAATAAAEQTYTLNVSTMAAAQSISTGDDLVITDDLVTDGILTSGQSFSIEGQEVTIEDGETLETLRTKINNAAENMDDDRRVRASIINDHLVITRELTGADDIVLSDLDSGTVLEDLGILSGGVIAHERVEGVDAEFTVNGISVTRSSNDVLDDVIEGVTLTLHSTGTTSLTVEPDREATKEAITAFVDAYNALAEQVDSYTTISMASSSTLTQKGELYGDSLATQIDSNLRKFVTDVKTTLTESNAGFTYNGDFGIMDSLGDIGIWTENESNLISITDEDKLDDMLEYQYGLVEQLFKGYYDSTEVAYVDGVASDFYSYINNISESMTGQIAVRIDALTEKYDTLADEIEEMEDALDDYEQKQWDIFTNMEDALAEMDAQLSYVESAFSSSS